MGEPSESLLHEVTRDIRPVRPLLPASLRSMIVVSIAALTVLMFLALRGVRADLDGLGPAFPILLALRLILGMNLLSTALREAVPSGSFPRNLVNSSLGLSTAVLLALPLALPGRAENHSFDISQMSCFISELTIALPAFALSYWLLARAYPLRPFVAATAAGLGVGLIADAALFAHCAIDQPIHVALAHEGAVLTVAVLGSLLGFLLPPNRRRLHGRE